MGAVIIFRDEGVINSSSRTGMLWQPLRVLLAKALRKREENRRLQPPGQYGYDSGVSYTNPQSLSALQNSNFGPGASSVGPYFQVPPSIYSQDSGMFMQQPQYPTMGTPYASDRRDMLMQEQQLVQMQNLPPFVVDEASVQGLGMSNLDMGDMGEANWDGWNQLVPGYQTQSNRYWHGA